MNSTARAFAKRHPEFTRVLGFALAILVTLLLPLAALRSYQNSKLGRLIEEIVSARRIPLPIRFVPQPNGTMLAAITLPEAERIHLEAAEITSAQRLVYEKWAKMTGVEWISVQYLAAQFDGRRCGHSNAQATFRYRVDRAQDSDNSYTIDIELKSPGVTTVLFPVYEFFGTHFSGVEMQRGDAPCLASLARIANPRQFKLMPTLVLPPYWRTLPRYEVLTDWSFNPFPRILGSLPRAPQYVLNQKISSWVLIGYSIDTDPLVSDLPTDMQLYWQVPPHVRPLPSKDFYRQSGDRWIQVLHGVQNLIPNGGFERGGDLRNFPQDIYTNAPGLSRKVVRDERQGRPTAVAEIKAPKASGSSLASDVIPVDSDTYYLQSAWMRAPDASAFMGRRWFPANRYSYDVVEASPGKWTRYAQVIWPYPGSHGAQVWLISEFGKARFDDIVFVELGRQNHNACVERNGELRCGPPIQPMDPSSAARLPRATNRLFYTVGDWTLTGYDLDEKQFERRDHFEIDLHWIAPVDVRPVPTQDFFHLSGREWIQRLPNVSNLVTNGAFERPLDTGNLLRDLYGKAPKSHQLKTVRRGGAETTVATLDSGESWSSYLSESLNVEPGRLYLQAGWLLGNGGASYIGRRWLPQEIYDYVIPAADPKTWTHYAQIVEPPQGSNQAEVILSNLKGKASFDDILFAEIGQPSADDCPRLPDGNRRCEPPLIQVPPLQLKEPQYRLNIAIGPWKLMGYDADERKLANDQPGDIRLYWLAPPGVEPRSSSNLRRVAGNQWVQVVRGRRNSVTDGAFEKGAPQVNFPNDIYMLSAASRQSAIELSRGAQHTVAMLANGPDFDKSSYVSEPIAIDKTHVYLQSGWIRTEDAKAYLGNQWLPNGSYGYVAAVVRPKKWTHYAAVLTPPAGGETTSTEVWLLNYESRGRAYFDDIVFVDLGMSNSDACDLANPLKRTDCGTPVR